MFEKFTKRGNYFVDGTEISKVSKVIGLLLYGD